LKLIFIKRNKENSVFRRHLLLSRGKTPQGKTQFRLVVAGALRGDLPWRGARGSRHHAWQVPLTLEPRPSWTV